MENRRQARKGLFMAMGAGVCWGTTGIFGTILFAEGFDPLSIASARTFFAFLAFLLFFLPGRLARLAVPRNELVLLASFSVIGVTLFNICYMQAVERVGISVAVVLLYTSPLFVILFSSLLLKERITRLKLVSIALLLLGTFLVVEAYQVSLLKVNATGILMGLGAGLSFGLLSIFGKISLLKADQMAKMFYLFLFGAFFLSLLHPPWLLFSQGFSSAALLSLAALVLIATFLAYALYIQALGYLEAGRASIAVAVEPVAAIFFAFFFFGEVLFAAQYMGVALVLGSIMLIGRY